MRDVEICLSELFRRLIRLEYLDQDHRKPLAGDRPLVRRAPRHEYQIALFDHVPLSADGRFRTPFAGRCFLGVDQRTAKQQRRRTFQHVVNVVRTVVDLIEVVNPLFVVKNRDARLLARRGDDIFVSIAGLFFQRLLNVGDLLF